MYPPEKRVFATAGFEGLSVVTLVCMFSLYIFSEERNK